MTDKSVAVDEIYSVLDCDGRRVGGCVLDFSAKHLTIVEDVFSDDLTTTVSGVLTQLPCSKIFLSSRADSNVCDWVKKQSERRSFTYEIIKGKNFAKENAIRAIDSIMESSADSHVYPMISELKFSKTANFAV
jgi:hypothetical protein